MSEGNEFLLGVLRQDCADLLMGMTFSTECFNITLSKALGLSILAGAFALKAPQMFNIIKNKTGDGIALSGLFIENLAFSNNTSYNYIRGYPFTTWGENAVITVSNALLGLLIGAYTPTASRFYLFLISIICPVFCVLACIEIIPQKVTEVLFSAGILIAIGAKAPQIMLNYQNKSTGSLSLITVIMQWAGCLARVFTTLQEIDDILPVVNVGVSFFLNSFVLFQIFIYWSNDKKPKAD